MKDKNKKLTKQKNKIIHLGYFYGGKLSVEDIDNLYSTEEWAELFEDLMKKYNGYPTQSAKEELLLKKLEEYQKLTFWDFFWGRDKELKKQINQLW